MDTVSLYLPQAISSHLRPCKPAFPPSRTKSPTPRTMPTWETQAAQLRSTSQLKQARLPDLVRHTTWSWLHHVILPFALGLFFFMSFFFGRLLALQDLASIYFGFCSQFKLHCPTSILEIRAKYDRISLAHPLASQQIMYIEQRTEDHCTFCLLCVSPSFPGRLDVQATPRPSLENQLLQLQLLVLCFPHLVGICRAPECIQRPCNPWQ